MSVMPTGRAASWGRRDVLLLAGLLLVCATLYSLHLGDVAFLGKDEPKNAQAAREMLERDDWVLTTLAGDPWYDKPILYYWTALVGYRMFGVGELGARVGPAVSALLTVWLTFLLGRRILGNSSGGALAALVLATGIEFWLLARMAVSDSILTCFITGSLVAYLLAREGVRPGLNLHLAWASAAMATLAKGPIGLLIPAMVIGVDLALARDWRGMLRLRWLTGPLLFLGIAAPWYALATIQSEGQFFSDFIVRNNWERFTTENLPHSGPFYYYLPVLLLGPFPWSVFLPTAIVRLARSFRTLPAVDRARYRTLLVWIGMPLLFFSVAGSKLPSYLLPTFPALAVILSREIRRLLAMPGRAVPRPLAVALVVFALVSAGLTATLLYFLGRHEPRLFPAALPLAVVLTMTALSSMTAALARLRGLAVAWVGAAAVLAPISVLLWGAGPLEGRASAREIARMAMSLGPGPGELLSYRFYDNSFFFYTDSQVERLWERRFVEDHVDRVGTALCFARQPDLLDILSSRRYTTERLATVGEVHLLRLTGHGPGRSSPAAGVPQGPHPAPGVRYYGRTGAAPGR